jgi:hypothetical protein
LELGPSGDEFATSSVIDIFDVDDNLIGTGCATAAGTRFEQNLRLLNDSIVNRPRSALRMREKSAAVIPVSDCLEFGFFTDWSTVVERS